MAATEDVFRNFFMDMDVSFDIPTGQPFRLYVLRRLAMMMEDPDADLIPLLISGVDLGIDSPIPSSHTWPSKDTSSVSENSDLDFKLFSENWRSAEADEDRLIQQEIQDGFVVEVGSLEQAKERFGNLLAIGKLGISSQQPDKPRLVLDSTISGLNPVSQQSIQEKCSYPNLHHLQRCVSPSIKEPYQFLNLDIKSAHKRIKVRSEHQGLLAFMFKDKVFHYQVLHFGGTCSAYYWTRPAAILLRFFHQFLYVHHFVMVFVDAFMFGLDSRVAPLQTSTLLLCCAFLNIPLSWHKLELGHHITWIGWSIDSWSDTISIPPDKLQKLLKNLYPLTTSGKFRRSEVEAIAGHLQATYFGFLRCFRFFGGYWDVFTGSYPDQASNYSAWIRTKSLRSWELWMLPDGWQNLYNNRTYPKDQSSLEWVRYNFTQDNCNSSQQLASTLILHGPRFGIPDLTGPRFRRKRQSPWDSYMIKLWVRYLGWLYPRTEESHWKRVQMLLQQKQNLGLEHGLPYQTIPMFGQVC